jgi:hypothetical protein
LSVTVSTYWFEDITYPLAQRQEGAGGESDYLLDFVRPDSDALYEWVKYKIQDVTPRAASEAIINIQTLELIEGKLPRRALNLVLDWAELHQAELIEDWNLCEAKQQPKPIAPLE